MAKGGLWTLRSITRAHHAIPLYAMQATTPETALRPFQAWLPAGAQGSLQLYFTPLDTPSLCTSEQEIG
jgi:hypothetical protein